MEHYGTEEGFVAYVEAMGYDIATSPSEEIVSGLLRGSVYIDGKYRGRFSGWKTGGRSQEREWPRTGATDTAGEEIADDEVPVEIERATYEAAFRELENPGSLMPDYVASERVESEKVGSLAVSYATSITMSAADAQPVIGMIDGILAPLIGGGASGSQLFGESTRI